MLITIWKRSLIEGDRRQSPDDCLIHLLANIRSHAPRANAIEVISWLVAGLWLTGDQQLQASLLPLNNISASPLSTSLGPLPNTGNTIDCPLEYSRTPEQLFDTVLATR